RPRGVMVSGRLVRHISRRNGGRLRRALRRSLNEGRAAWGPGASVARGAGDIPPSCRDYRGGRDWSPRREAAGVSRSSVEPQLRVARKGLDADRTAAGPVAVFEAGAGSVALAHHVGARGLDVAAERAGFDAGRGVAGKSQ